MTEQPKFNYQPQNEDSPEAPLKEKTSWMWSLVVLVIMAVITLVIGGVVGVTNGRSTAREYNISTKEYLTTLADEIERSKTATDIAISIRASKQPELKRAFLGGLSNTYRQARETSVKVEDVINKVIKENQAYINLAELTNEATNEQVSLNENIAILIKSTGEVERKNQLIILDQSCSRLTDLIKNTQPLPDIAQKEASAYTTSVSTMCATLKNLNDAHNRKDYTRLTNGLKVVKENNKTVDEALTALQDIAKNNISDSKNIVTLLRKTGEEILNF